LRINNFTMKAKAYLQFYLSVFLLLFIFNSENAKAGNLYSGSFIIEIDEERYDLTRNEKDLFHETSPSRHTVNGVNPEFQLGKYDSWPLLYNDQDFIFRPNSFSGGLFVYGNEFVDVGNGKPGSMGDYRPTYKKMFFLRVGKDILIYLLDWFWAYSSGSNYYSCYHYSGYSGIGGGAIGFYPTTWVQSIPRSYLVPVNGPVKPGNTGYPVFVDPQTPTGPKPRVLEARNIPDPIDGDEIIVPIQERFLSNGKSPISEEPPKPLNRYKNSSKIIQDYKSDSEFVQDKPKPKKRKENSRAEKDNSDSYSNSLYPDKSERESAPSISKPRKISKPRTSSQPSRPSRSGYSPSSRPTKSTNTKPRSSYSRPSRSQSRPVARPVSRPRPAPRPVVRPARPKPASRPVVRPTSRPRPTPRPVVRPARPKPASRPVVRPTSRPRPVSKPRSKGGRGK
jgi:hypothetical protein